MSFVTYMSFIVTCFIIEATPGPNMAYLAVLSADQGRKAGFAATIGIALGLFTVGFATALGIGALILNSEIAYQGLRIGGILYLLWLAWDSWKEETEAYPVKCGSFEKHAKYFKRGLVVNLLNPKAALFYIAILPTYISSSSSAIFQAIILTITYVAIATIMHSIIVMLAGTAQNFLEDPHKRIITRRILSLALAAIALWFAWSTHKIG
ncbi:MAG: LysE family translocator [Alphaproteobacteria bacterium]|nr:LysE family translocator [Alphaproteobacteria bacterium]